MQKGITFDEDFKIRILDADEYKQTEELQVQCSQFSQKITQLKDGELTVAEKRTGPCLTLPLPYSATELPFSPCERAVPERCCYGCGVGLQVFKG